jgi:inner membrane protein
MKIEITNQEKWHQSLTLKLALLAFIGLLFLIPLEMIKLVIKERQSKAEEVKKEISKQWAEKQFLAGPVLNIPLKTIPTEKDEKSRTEIWHILPESLDITGNIIPEIRYRGIFQSVVYESDLQQTGEFIIPDISKMSNYEILWNESYYTVGITDNRGLKGRIVLKIDSSELEAIPGVKDQELFQSGISFINPVTSPEEKIRFTLNLKLSGSEGLLLTPLGKITKANLHSGWSSPSFKGSFLPAKRSVSDKGFSASWEVTHLNRNFPQDWTGASFHPLESSFGLDLFLPVDHYQKSWRSARYGILFIALTFLVLVFLEITRKEYIHVFHYFLVSLGLILFFSLLNSLSEQVGFNLSYLIASAATILLISLFTGTLMRNKKTAYIVFGMLVILYSFIFILLTLNDYAYLAGNIGLFILLAVIMKLAGNIKLFRKESVRAQSESQS